MVVNAKLHLTATLPAQKRMKTSESTCHPKAMTSDSPLLPHGLDITGYDFKVNEVRKHTKKRTVSCTIYHDVINISYDN